MTMLRYTLLALPVSLVLRDAYDSAVALRRYTGRALVVLAAEDEIVPARHGHALFDALPGPKRLYTVAAAGHNDWADQVAPAWWAAALKFFSEGAVKHL